MIHLTKTEACDKGFVSITRDIDPKTEDWMIPRFERDFRDTPETACWIFSPAGNIQVGRKRNLIKR